MVAFKDSIVMNFHKEPTKVGELAEGDPCPRCGDGVLGPNVTDCYCHQITNPPCRVCTEITLVCDTCWEEFE